jgi:hypothetical protein
VCFSNDKKKQQSQTIKLVNQQNRKKKELRTQLLLQKSRLELFNQARVENERLSTQLDDLMKRFTQPPASQVRGDGEPLRDAEKELAERLARTTLQYKDGQRIEESNDDF